LFTVPAYLRELANVEARATDEGTVHVGLRADQSVFSGLVALPVTRPG